MNLHATQLCNRHISLSSIWLLLITGEHWYVGLSGALRLVYPEKHGVSSLKID